MSTENNTPQDDASTWYGERVADTRQQIEAKLNEISSAHSALENTWNGLDEAENTAHDELNTREIVRIQNERQRILGEANQLSQGYAALQSERQRLELSPDPTFNELIANSSPKSQLWLRVHRHKIENDPNALKRLLLASARASAAGLRPDSNHYFSALETAAGLDASDRRLDDFDELSDEMQASKHSARREDKNSFKPTPEQLEMSKSLHGLDSGSYLKACAQPFSQASEATQHVDHASFDTNQYKSMEINFEQETPRKTVSKDYKPGPSAVTLSAAQVDLAKQEASLTNRPVKEVLREHAMNKLAIERGESGHYRYTAEKLRSEGHR